MTFIFGKPKSGTDKSLDPYAEWPKFPLLSEGGKLRLFDQQALKSGPSRERPGGDGFKFDPALIIGFGETGENALRYWMDNVANSPLKVDDLRAVLFSAEADKRIDSIEGSPICRVFSLNKSQTGKIQQAQPSREYFSRQFNQAEVYQAVKEFLLQCVEALRSDIKVFIVGSMADPMAGILGNLLQLLGLMHNFGDRYFHTINAVLVVDLKQSAGSLPFADIHASLRELGRFTFRGIHVMAPAIGEKVGTFDTNLIDHVFMIENLESPKIPTSGKDPIDRPAQALAEAVYNLCHPSSQVIWERIKNIGTIANQIRKDHAFPVVHGYGVATQYLPVNQILNYASWRITRDVLFGDQGSLPQGFLAPKGPSRDGVALARLWLKSDPYDHPVFNWLVSITHVKDLDRIPEMNPELAHVFIQKIAVHLNLFFQEFQQAYSLIAAAEAVDWLRKQINQTSQFARQRSQAKLPPDGLDELVRQTAWIGQALDGLSQSIQAWIRVGGIATSPLVNDQSPARERQMANDPFERLLGNSREQNRGKIADLKEPTSGSEPFEGGIQAYLQTRIETERIELEKASLSNTRHSIVNLDTNDGLERLYSDLFRPDFKQEADPSGFYGKIRNRVGWWARTMLEKYECELTAVCLPVDWQKGDDLAEAYFHAKQGEDFIQQIHKLSLRVLEDFSSQITPNWFDRKLERQSNLLESFQPSFLNSDRDQVAALKDENVAKQLGFMVGRDKNQADKYLNIAFEHFSEANRISLSGNDSFRLSAFGLTFCVPLTLTLPYLRTFGEYRYKDAIHLYSQERNARIYEKKARELDWEGEDRALTSAISLALADEILVKIFFRALFCGLIALESTEKGYSKYLRWIVKPINGFDQLVLCQSDTAKDLINAFQRFTLELPFGKAETITLHGLMAAENRKKYLNSLLSEINQYNQVEENRLERSQRYRELRKRLEREPYLDAVTRDFLRLMDVEYDSQWETLNFLS